MKSFIIYIYRTIIKNIYYEWPYKIVENSNKKNINKSLLC